MKTVVRGSFVALCLFFVSGILSAQVAELRSVSDFDMPETTLDTLTISVTGTVPGDEFDIIVSGSGFPVFLISSATQTITHPQTKAEFIFRSFTPGTRNFTVEMKDHQTQQLQDTESFTITVKEVPPATHTVVYDDSSYTHDYDTIVTGYPVSGTLVAYRNNGTMDGDTTFVISKTGVLEIDNQNILLDNDRTPPGMGAEIPFTATQKGLDTLLIIAHKKTNPTLRDTMYLVVDVQRFRFTAGTDDGATNEDTQFNRTTRILGAKSLHTNTVTITESDNLIESFNYSISYAGDTAVVAWSAIPKDDAYGRTDLTFRLTDETVNDFIETDMALDIRSKNDAPRFSFATDYIVKDEDFEAFTIPIFWDNPANESSETLTVTLNILSQELATLTYDDDNDDIVVTKKDHMFGLLSVEISVFDGELTTKDTIEIDITAVNDPPTFTLSQTTVERDEDFVDTVEVTVDYTPVFGEGDQQVLYSLVGEAPDFLNVTVEALTGTVHIWSVPDKDYSTVLLLEANDQEDNNNTYRTALTVTIHSVDDRPIAVADTFYTDEDQNYGAIRSTGVLVNDIDIDTHPNDLSCVLVRSVEIEDENSFVFDSDGGFLFIPPTDFFGEKTFEYAVFDGTSYSDTVTSVIIVHPINDPPVALIDTFVCLENEYFFLRDSDFLRNDSDVDNDHIDLSLVDILHRPENGRFYDPSDIIFFRPDRNFSGVDSLIYVLSDGMLRDTMTSYFVIENINNVPQGNPDFPEIYEGDTLDMNVLLNDTDLDNDNLEAVFFSGPSHGTYTTHYDGSLRYIPDPYYFGKDTIVYKPNDGHKLGNLTEVIITIYPVDSPNIFSLTPQHCFVRPGDTLIIDIDETIPYGETETTWYGCDHPSTIADITFDATEKNISLVAHTEGIDTVLVSGDQFTDTLFITVSFDRQTIHFKKGWNMFSTSINLINSDLDSLFATKIDSVFLIKNGSGRVYLPQYDIDDIDSLQTHEGYLLYAVNEFNKTFTGWRESPQTPIALTQGWNMISYLPTYILPVEEAFSSVQQNLFLVKNGSGEIFLPQYNINQIGTTKPTSGYLVYMHQPDTLYYPPIQQAKRGICTVPQSDVRLDVAPSSTSMTLLLSVPDTRLEGHDLVVKTSSGLCIGAGIVYQGNACMTIWGDNDHLEGRQGALDFEDIHLFDEQSNTELTVSSMINLSTHKRQPLQFVRSSVFSAEVQSSSIHQIGGSDEGIIITPNPAQSETTLQFFASTHTVDIHVVDINGKTVFSQVLTSCEGWNEYVLDASSLSSGQYSVWITTQTGSQKAIFHVVH